MKHFSSPVDPPADSPGQSPGQSRRAPDLAAFEQAVAGRLAALPRAAAPEALRLRCLAAAAGPGLVGAYSGSLTGPGARPLTALRPSTFRLWWPTAAAAALLCLLGVPGSRGGSDPDTTELNAATFVSLRVVDDPSVSLFHGVETFDELVASRPELASAEPAGSGSPR